MIDLHKQIGLGLTFTADTVSERIKYGGNAYFAVVSSDCHQLRRTKGSSTLTADSQLSVVGSAQGPCCSRTQHLAGHKHRWDIVVVLQLCNIMHHFA